MNDKLTIYEIRKETIVNFKTVTPHDDWKTVNNLVDNLIAYYRDNYVSRYKYETSIKYNIKLEAEIRQIKLERKNLRESLVFVKRHILK